MAGLAAMLFLAVGVISILWFGTVGIYIVIPAAFVLFAVVVALAIVVRVQEARRVEAAEREARERASRLQELRRTMQTREGRAAFPPAPSIVTETPPVAPKPRSASEPEREPVGESGSLSEPELGALPDPESMPEPVQELGLAPLQVAAELAPSDRQEEAPMAGTQLDGGTREKPSVEIVVLSGLRDLNVAGILRECGIAADPADIAISTRFVRGSSRQRVTSIALAFEIDRRLYRSLSTKQRRDLCLTLVGRLGEAVVYAADTNVGSRSSAV